MCFSLAFLSSRGETNNHFFALLPFARLASLFSRLCVCVCVMKSCCLPNFSQNHFVAVCDHQQNVCTIRNSSFRRLSVSYPRSLVYQASPSNDYHPQSCACPGCDLGLVGFSPMRRRRSCGRRPWRHEARPKHRPRFSFRRIEKPL